MANAPFSFQNVRSSSDPEKSRTGGEAGSISKSKQPLTRHSLGDFSRLLSWKSSHDLSRQVEGKCPNCGFKVFGSKRKTSSNSQISQRSDNIPAGARARRPPTSIITGAIRSPTQLSSNSSGDTRENGSSSNISHHSPATAEKKTSSKSSLPQVLRRESLNMIGTSRAENTAPVKLHFISRALAKNNQKRRWFLQKLARFLRVDVEILDPSPHSSAQSIPKQVESQKAEVKDEGAIHTNTTLTADTRSSRNKALQPSPIAEHPEEEAAEKFAQNPEVDANAGSNHSSDTNHRTPGDEREKSGLTEQDKAHLDSRAEDTEFGSALASCRCPPDCHCRDRVYYDTFTGNRAVRSRRSEDSSSRSGRVPTPSLSRGPSDSDSNSLTPSSRSHLVREMGGLASDIRRSYAPRNGSGGSRSHPPTRTQSPLAFMQSTVDLEPQPPAQTPSISEVTDETPRQSTESQDRNAS